MKDFLLEVYCEELPPKLLLKLVDSLVENFTKQLKLHQLSYTVIQSFATPKRLAFLVKNLSKKQKNIQINKKGPNVAANAQAITGFAKTNNTNIDNLTRKQTTKGEYYYYQNTIIGKNTADLLADICKNAIKNITIHRPMRWGNNKFSFIRPVHSIIALFGEQIIPLTIMNVVSGNTTKGLRFIANNNITINNATDYQQIMLDVGLIEVDFIKRRDIISTQIQQIAAENNALIIKDNELLNEVCALVEHPQAFIGKFDSKFLSLPKEVITQTMREHQKYFSVVDINNKLLSNFIAVANVVTTDMSTIIAGNQKVIKPRLNDAQFFWQQDSKNTLFSYVDKLKNILFMQDLGSMYDKSQRLVILTKYIANIINADNIFAARAALLSKADLSTNMVVEFPNLQGIIGSYYAKKDNENKLTIDAIYYQYYPRFAGDKLPNNAEGICVSIADKIDSICGIFGINNQPTGSKDPYALRRLALGLMRIIIEKKLNINLKNLIIFSLKLYFNNADNEKFIQIHNFMLERLKVYYHEKNIDTTVFLAASKINNNNPYDVHLRINALNSFSQKPDAKNLIIANKRIFNILKKSEFNIIDKYNFTTDIDKTLYKNIIKSQKVIASTTDYEIIINELLSLKIIIDEFFNTVMINDKDEKIKNTRLNLINLIRKLFLNIGDIALLAK